jgi:putative ABC transport system ATP-binding protein
MMKREPPRAAEALRLVSVVKVYRSSGVPVAALNGVNLWLAPGTFTAVMGPSGSGKSTLLYCASGLDQPSSGKVYVAGAAMPAGSETELTRFRRKRIGFVFQQFNLLPALTVRQNVLLPLRLAGERPDEARFRAIVERVGLAGRLDRRPSELSGGEQQRTAVARGLVTQPAILFADEPTGALDARNAREVLALLSEAVRAFGQTVIMVTHDPTAAAHAGSVLFLSDGHIVDEMATPTAAAIAERMTRLGDPAPRTTRAEA